MIVSTFQERDCKEVADVITPEHIETLKDMGYEYDYIFTLQPKDADYIINNGRKPEEIDTSKRVNGPKVEINI